MSKSRYPDKKLGRHRKGVDWKDDPERVIVARYRGHCGECLEDIEIGEWVLWTPGGRLRHQDCKDA